MRDLDAHLLGVRVRDGLRVRVGVRVRDGLRVRVGVRVRVRVRVPASPDPKQADLLAANEGDT